MWLLSEFVFQKQIKHHVGHWQEKLHPWLQYSRRLNYNGMEDTLQYKGCVLNDVGCKKGSYLKIYSQWSALELLQNLISKLPNVGTSSEDSDSTGDGILLAVPLTIYYYFVPNSFSLPTFEKYHITTHIYHHFLSYCFVFEGT